MNDSLFLSPEIDITIKGRTFVSLHVILEFLYFLKGARADIAGIRPLLGVRPSDVAVVRGVGGERLSAVPAFEGFLAGMLPDVRP